MIFKKSPWCEENDARKYVGQYKNVLLVCVFEDYMQDGGRNKYSEHHFKGSVVRTYTGDWKLSEKINFVIGYDYSIPSGINLSEGKLIYLLTNEHSSSEIGFDTGDYYFYKLFGVVPHYSLYFVHVTG